MERKCQLPPDFQISFVPGEVTVVGCMGVAVYEDEVILLRLERGGLEIRGSGLLLKSYYAGEMQITGKIRGMELCSR